MPEQNTILPEYNTRQQIFALNVASIVVGNEHGSQSDLEALATTRLNDIFSDSDVKKQIGNWKVVWGPAVYQLDHKVKFLGTEITSNVADSVMYMAKCEDVDSDQPDRYVIGIAGTNPVSIFGWLVEDFWVNRTILWNQGQPWEADITDQTTPGKRVSAGTTTGLWILLEEMKSKNGQSLLNYLKDITKSATKPLSITICGHSLGGALSPTLALSLMDQEDKWNYNNKATLSVSPSAGPTPGNDKFAEYYDSKLGDVTDRIWHYLDFVPHGWGLDTLEETRTFYDPCIPTNAAINLYVNIFKYLSSKSGVTYKAICSKQQESFRSKYVPQTTSKPSDAQATMLLQWITKMVLSIMRKKPTKDEGNTVGEILRPLVEAFIKGQSGEISSSDETTKIDPKPYVEKIIGKIPQTETGFLDINGLPQESTGTEDSATTKEKDTTSLKDSLAIVISGLPEFYQYMLQVSYQHTMPYFNYMGINDFLARMGSYGVQLS